MRTRRESMLAGLLVAGVASCHLLVGPDDAGCDPSKSGLELEANREQHRLDGCVPFQCSADGKIKRVSMEVSDGYDNDCDGRVDEGVWNVPARALPRPPGEPDGLRATWSSTRGTELNTGVRVFLTGAQGRGYFYDVDWTVDGASRGRSTLLPLRVRDGVPLLAEARGECPVCQDRTFRVGDCLLGDLVGTQWSDGNWLLGARDDVTTEGRAPLRLGLGGAEGDRFVQAVNSPLAAGVGVSREGDTCRYMDSAASRISVAASVETTDGLVAWIGSAMREPPSCGSPRNETPTVRVLPVHLDGGVLTAMAPPSDLGATVERSGRPAVLPIPGLGAGSFLVGFAQRDGVSLCVLRPGQWNCDVGRRFHIADQDVEQVAMTGARDRTSTAVGIVWTTGCGTSLKFARVDLSGSGMTMERPQTEVVRLAPGEGLSSPTIAWSDTSFRVLGHRREDSDPCVGGAPADEHGGWVVSWVSASGGEHLVRAVRIDSDGVRSPGRAACEPVTEIHRFDEAVEHHALHRMMRGGRAIVVSLTTTGRGAWFGELHGMAESR